jgi:hypothetical protein
MKNANLLVNIITAICDLPADSPAFGPVEPGYVLDSLIGQPKFILDETNLRLAGKSVYRRVMDKAVAELRSEPLFRREPPVRDWVLHYIFDPQAGTAATQAEFDHRERVHYLMIVNQDPDEAKISAYCFPVHEEADQLIVLEPVWIEFSPLGAAVLAETLPEDETALKSAVMHATLGLALALKLVGNPKTRLSTASGRAVEVAGRRLEAATVHEILYEKLSHVTRH